MQAVGVVEEQALNVIPAKAGTQGYNMHRSWLWVPAFAGMTE